MHLVTLEEKAVYDRYAAAAKQPEAALCCAVPYDRKLLEVIPAEVLERDYGCGDPTRYVRPGETVLDLGSGSGKVCFMLSQVVGAAGRVIGVDCNDEMLSLSRRHQAEVARKLGYGNVEFRRGLIQDLALDLDLLEEHLARQPVSSSAAWLEMRQLEDRLRRERPLVSESCIDCIVSNCVLNLVRRQDRVQLFDEMFRVLKPGGRAAISDIVADRPIPERLRQDPELFSGCLSGAFGEEAFLDAFAAAGFCGMQIVQRQPSPWQVVEGIEFRSMTVVACKPLVLPATQERQEVIYRGPFREVAVDGGHEFVRGRPILVSQQTLAQLQCETLSPSFEVVGVPPATCERGGCCT